MIQRFSIQARRASEFIDRMNRFVRSQPDASARDRPGFLNHGGHEVHEEKFQSVLRVAFLGGR